MRIQDALSNCCEGIKEFASAAANWIGKTVSATGAFIAEIAAKVAEFVKPHFEHLKTFAQEHKDMLSSSQLSLSQLAQFLLRSSQTFFAEEHKHLLHRLPHMEQQQQQLLLFNSRDAYVKFFLAASLRLAAFFMPTASV